MISQRTIDAVYNAVNIKDVVSRFHELHRQGSGYVCVCPFHQDRKPSLHINERRNIYKCFACGAGGGPIKFLMEDQSMSYPEAIKFAAGIYNIPVEEETKELNEQEREDRLRRESALITMQSVQEFFEKSLLEDRVANRKARDYAHGRRGAEFCGDFGIGYAPWPKEFLAFVKEKHLDEQILFDLGMLRQKNDGTITYMFANRVTIPIRDRWGRVIAYTARSLEDDPQCKYINSTTSLIYSKRQSVFGIEIAKRTSNSASCLYIVEGAPDVMRLQSIGIDNVVAPLGLEWSDEQFAAVKAINDRICFIPDSEATADGTLGPGFKGVLKTGKQAMEQGFHVTVREIPLTDGETKQDADTYCISTAILNEIPEEDFVMWYAEKQFLSATTELSRVAVVKDVCDMLAAIEDKSLAASFLESLQKKYKQKNTWKLSFNSAVLERRNNSGNKEEDSQRIEKDLYLKYGFFIADNCYCTYGKNGEVRRFSNFILIPMYSIPDEGSNTRLFKIMNNLGQSALIDFEPEELANLQKFRMKITTAGNFVWLGKIDDLVAVQEYIFKGMETAKRIRELGWQEEGFFAYGDGIFTDRFIHVDEMGMVKLPSLGLFYLPAYSVMHRKNRQKFPFEKAFIYNHSATITLADMFKLFIEVFGDNGKVALSWMFATLFRDFIFEMLEVFPLLNIYGKPQSGKSQLGKAIRGFFTSSNKPINYEGETYPAINRALEQTANCAVHFDEYKNSIEWRKVELLKSMWDGVGRGKMKDGDVERVNVNCGVIISGQEMPTIDPALFTRIIHLTVNKVNYTTDERKRFADLMNYIRQGICHLTMQIVKCRPRFVEDFPHYYEITRTEVENALSVRGERLSDRMHINWVIILASFRTLERLLPMPFTYDDLLAVSLEMMIEQNSITKRSDEVATFWNFVQVLYQESRIFNDADFKILHGVTSLKLLNGTELNFSEPRDVLIIRHRRILQHYQTDKARATKQIVLSEDDMRKYLERSTPCFGMVKRKFHKYNQYGQPVRESKPDGGVGRQLLDVDQALAFDHQQLMSLYHLYLEANTSALTDEEIREQEEAERRREAAKPKQEKLPF